MLPKPARQSSVRAGHASMSEIRAPITGNVWKILVAEGDAVAVDDVVAILESMKLEIPVEAETARNGDPRASSRSAIAVTEDDPMFELS